MTKAGAEAGFEFFEWTTEQCLQPGKDEEAFQASLERLGRAALPCEALNCFIPAQLKITGPTADLERLRQYVECVCCRAQVARIQTIVFGSGGARHVPPDFERERAQEQIVAFCRMVAPQAASHGVTVVVEPLSQGDTNVLNRLHECAEVVQVVAHPALKLLVDSYHWSKEKDSLEDLARFAPLLSHVHVATVPSRLPPGAEPCDFELFFRTLRRAGYGGRVSVEAPIAKPAEQLPQAMRLLRSLASSSKT